MAPAMLMLNASTRDDPDVSNKRAKPFGRLAIDTSFSRHNGQRPTQMVAPATKAQQLTFISFDNVKGQKQKQDTATKQTLQPDSGLIARRPPVNQPSTDSRRVAAETESHVLDVPLHKRVRGLRPASLDLTQDVSPSDRAIPIGIALSPSTVSHLTKPVDQPPPYEASKAGPKLPTPTIVITPAREEFPDDILVSKPHRPTSSVYSRYTNCMPTARDLGRTPPVPPLPLFINTTSRDVVPRHKQRASDVTAFEEDMPSAAGVENKTLSTCTVFEEDAKPRRKTHQSFRQSTPGLSTPRRSKGWWNLVLSPFSAKSANSHFFKSPTAMEASPDDMPMLSAAAEMGYSDGHQGLILSNRASDDDELRSAPASGPHSPVISPAKPLPKRSDTAPGALDTDDHRLNIYRIPSQGLARAYYDKDRHFPSLCLASDSPSTRAHARALEDMPDGWSPSQSVFVQTPRGLAEEYYDPNVSFSSPSQSSDNLEESKSLGAAHGLNNPESPHNGTPSFDPEERSSRSLHSENGHDDEDEAILPRDMLSGEPHRPTPARAVTTEPTPQVAMPDAAVFSTPCDDELRSVGGAKPPAARSATNDTAVSYFSPMSATPVVEDAHVATFAGPRSNFGEQREINLDNYCPPLPPSPARADPKAATAQREAPPLPPSPIPARPTHVRQDSQGLGIFNGDTEPLTTVQTFTDKRELEQGPNVPYESHGLEGEMKSKTPWFRRFILLFAVIAICLFIMMIALLAAFVPRSPKADIPVQAAWLNTTGFPAMPTGISTVIQPKNVQSEEGCVQPSAVWSCDNPSDLQSGSPSFRLEIRFRNGTLPSNETALVSGGRTGQQNSTSETSNLSKRGSDPVFSPWPNPPSSSDQQFMGHTTDNVSVPYDGETTPFYISLLNSTSLPVASPGSFRKRDSTFQFPYPDANSSDSVAGTTVIPPPALRSGGEPSSDVLTPLVQAQPLKLFNRDQDTEHYGFYTYFDRSVYLAGLTNATANASDTAVTSNVPLSNASAVCTWSQTRFHVQIWTRRGFVTALASGNSSTPAGNSTANDMQAPGSFPYPVTITLDRHGGEAEKKGVYCYGIQNGTVDRSDSWWVAEDRGEDLINPAPVPGSNVAVESSASISTNSSAGQGIDGGNGGCMCQWMNVDA